MTNPMTDTMTSISDDSDDCSDPPTATASKTVRSFREESKTFLKTLDVASKHRRKHGDEDNSISADSSQGTTGPAVRGPLLDRGQRNQYKHSEPIKHGNPDSQMSRYTGVLDLPPSNDIDLRNKPALTPSPVPMALPPVTGKDKSRLDDLMNPCYGSVSSPGSNRRLMPMGSSSPTISRSLCRSPAEPIKMKTRTSSSSNRISLDASPRTLNGPIKVVHGTNVSR